MSRTYKPTPRTPHITARIDLYDRRGGHVLILSNMEDKVDAQVEFEKKAKATAALLGWQLTTMEYALAIIREQ